MSRTVSTQPTIVLRPHARGVTNEGTGTVVTDALSGDGLCFSGGSHIFTDAGEVAVDARCHRWRQRRLVVQKRRDQTVPGRSMKRGEAMNRFIRTLAVAAVVALAVYPAKGQTIDPPNSIVAGQPIADWTLGWWTWALSFSAVTGQNPFTDPTGALATVNNNGPVFYVAGTQGGASQPRHFTVGANTPLLFAMVNQAWIQYPVPLLHEVAADFFTGSANLIATIDGVPVPNLTSYAETSDIGSLGLAVPGSLGELEGPTPGFVADPADCPNFTPDLLCPAISMGYYLMVNLPPGEHTITTGGTLTYDLPNDPTYFPGGGQVTIDTLTTDIIDVAIPEPGSALLLFPAVLGVSLLRKRASAPSASGG
jgi:hypothetical protein